MRPYLPEWASSWLGVQTPPPGNTVSAGGDKAGRRHASSSPVMVTVVKAEPGALPVLRPAIGAIVPVASTSLSSQAAGMIAEVLVKDGSIVKSGDLLVRIDDRTIKANITRDMALLAKDQATLDNANSTLRRIQGLASAGVDTKQQSDDANAAVKVAQATIGVDQASLAADQVLLAQTEIQAPFDGKLGVVLVSKGAFVAPGATIVTLTQMKPIYAEFTLPETDLDLARTALTAGKLTIEAAPMLGSETSPKISGPIVFIDNAVDPASATFKLRALIDNADDALWPGQSINVEAKAGELGDLVLVPSVAVQPHSDGSICFVVKADQTIEVRKVEVAVSVGDMTGISKGLEAGETVVTEGQATLTQGVTVAVAATKEATVAASNNEVVR